MPAAARPPADAWPVPSGIELLAPSARTRSWTEKVYKVPADRWLEGDRELFTGKVLPPPENPDTFGAIRPLGRIRGRDGFRYFFDPAKQLPTLRRTS